MARVGLNVDLGELDGEPEELYALADQCNVACGGHAGDAASMARAARLARATGATVAAHPSYPDRARFGRASLAMTPAEIAATVADQCRALAAAARGAGIAIDAVKAHGALYHDAARDPAVAAAVLDGVRAGLGVDVRVVGPPTGAIAEEAAARGIAYAREGFADRAYRDDGTIVPRDQPGALLEGPAACAAQAVTLARAGTVDTICVHGDGAGAVLVLRAVRGALAAAGLLVRRGGAA